MANNCSGELAFPASVVLALLYGIIALPALLGNAVFLWVIYKARNVRTLSNLLLSSLALADFLVGLIIDPVWIARCVLKPHPYNHPFKVAIDALWIQTSVTTTFSLCAVSVDRYIAIQSALLYHQMVTEKRCYIAIAFVWIASLSFGFSRIVVTNPSNLPKLWMCVTIITILLPMLLIVFCYSRISVVAIKQSKTIARQDVQRSNKLVSERIRNQKAAKTVGLVITLFFISWLPTLAASFIHLTTSNHCNHMRVVWLWVELVAFSSSGINPWLNSLRNREFRAEVNRVLRIKCLKTEWISVVPTPNNGTCKKKPLKISKLYILCPQSFMAINSLTRVGQTPQQTILF